MGFPVIPTTAVVAQVTYVDAGYVVVYDAVAKVHVVQVGYLAEYQNLTIKAASVIFPTRFVADVVNPLDGTVLSTTKVLDDTPVLQEFVGIDFDKPLTDSFSMIDQVDIAYDIGKVLADTYATLDATTVTSGKGVTDSVFMIDNMDGDIEFALIKTLSELQFVTDSLIAVVGKQITDTFTGIDTASLALGKNFTESVTESDSSVIDFGKNSTDSIALQEVLVAVLGKSFADSFTGIDTTAYAFAKVLADVSTVSDQSTIASSLQKADNTVLDDAGLLVMQDYCDITYFLEDYVGQSRTFT
jgi:hypothetical protein